MKNVKPPVKKCDFCGRHAKAVAETHGGKRIPVCRSCYKEAMRWPETYKQ
ncbi:MAG: hypothetical protein LLG00_14885 [Planctomycetaceae bacterium]|nr:hypothetical protein [Planctomycetaceae bacterium]